MPCSTEYGDLMSLKLDGLITEADDLHLKEHIETCADCGLLWAAMKQADEILRVSALQPMSVPSNFHSKVMMQIAVSAPAPVLKMDPLYAPSVGSPVSVPVMRHATRRLGETPTGYLPAGYIEWQKRIAGYVRGIAAVGLSIAGTFGLLLALALSGTIKLEGPAAEAMGTVRTLFQAIDTWVRSLFVGFGPGFVAVGALMAGILVLVGWQVVSGYHRAAMESRGNTGRLEAMA